MKNFFILYNIHRLVFVVIAVTLLTTQIILASNNKNNITNFSKKENNLEEDKVLNLDEEKYYTDWREYKFREISQDLSNPRFNHYLTTNSSIGGSAIIDLKEDSTPQTKLTLNSDFGIGNFLNLHGGFFYTTCEKCYNFSSKNDNDEIVIEELYAEFHNFEESSVYLKIGKQYLPFGRYQRLQISPSFDQTLSLIRKDSVNLGFISTNGFYGSVFGFEGSKKKDNQSNKDFGFTLGLEKYNPYHSIDIGMSYINNLVNVLKISKQIENGYENRVDGINLFLNISIGNLGYQIRYLSALDNFSKNDLAFQNKGQIYGAKPKVFTITTNYDFRFLERYNRLKFSYQKSSESLATNSSEYELDLPKLRLSLTHAIALEKYLIFAGELRFDKEYDISQGGNGNDDLIFLFRALFLI